MFDRIRGVLALATLALLPAAGCAHAYEGYDRGQVLAELPADAPPGECYARVKVPEGPHGPPPTAQGAHWVMTPGPYGSPGPIWCLVPNGPAAIAAPPIERYGWIRVLCDRDATPERIGKVQRELHRRGYYRGDASGRYDEATAEALARFQSGAHIDHRGYLSMDTLDALDEGAYASGYAAVSGYGYQSSSAYGSSGYSYGYGGPAYAPAAPVSPCLQPCAFAPPAPPPPPVYVQPSYPCCQTPAPLPASPCCGQPYAPPPCCAATQGYGGTWWGGPSYGGPSYGGAGYGYGAPVPAYASGYAGYGSTRSVSAVQNGWLTWNGKPRF